MDLRGRSALVVGLGRSGVAAARLLSREGARLLGADDKPPAELGEAAREVAEVRPIQPASLRGVDLVVLSPGVPLSLPIFAEARARGIEVLGEVELAARFVMAAGEPIVGITGTNGKSTTTALTGHLLATAGKRVFAGGNLGTALSTHVVSAARADAVVCELSSYQLEAISTLRCAAATVLNVTPDHLDRYPSIEEYARAKERIFENQRPGDLAALNVADARVSAMRTRPGVVRAVFDPRLPGSAADAGRTGPRSLRVDGASLELRASTLRGAHNAENALAACLLARHLGAEASDLQRGLDTYPGLPHRLEPVRILRGIEWINDSKATNVDSVEKSLSAFESNVVLILGGKGKGAPYAPLRDLIRGRVKAVLTIGQDAPAIESELAGAAPISSCGTLAAAVETAAGLARTGDVVLLSPACASFDQFRNFEDRGDQFKAMVRGLA